MVVGMGVGAVASLQEGIDALAAVDDAALSDDELGAVLRELSRAEAQLAAQRARLLGTSTHAGPGHRWAIAQRPRGSPIVARSRPNALGHKFGWRACSVICPSRSTR